MNKTPKLTEKQHIFIEALMESPQYVVADAARVAYPNSKRPQTIGYETANKPHVKAEIDKRKAERSEKARINADYVLNRCIEIDQMDVLDILNDDLSFKSLSEWPKVWRTTLSAIDINKMSVGDDAENVMHKIKWPDKVKNLELIGRHTSVSAFNKDKEGSATEELVDAISSVIDRLPN